MWKEIPYFITLYKIKYIFLGRKFKLKMLIYEALKRRLIFRFETNILGDRQKKIIESLLFNISTVSCI